MIKPIKPADKTYVKALIFADHGKGKTFFLGTAQNDERTFPMALLDFEGNTETLAGLDIDVYPVRSWQDFREVYQILNKNVEGYKSIGIDSITEVNQWALMEVMHEGRNEANRKIGPFDEPDKAFQSDYGDVLIQMRRLLRRFRDLPFHVFYTALMDKDTIPKEGVVRLPKMLGQMQGEVGALMWCVAAIIMEPVEKEVGGKKVTTLQRIMLLHDQVGYQAKVRTPWEVKTKAVPEYIVNPTVTKLMDALQPETKKATTAQKEVDTVV